MAGKSGSTSRIEVQTLDCCNVAEETKDCCRGESGAQAGTEVGTGGTSRRNFLKAMGGVALWSSFPGAIVRAQSRRPDLKHVKLAFCSQLLCVTPYEVAHAHGFFEDEGLDVELVYTRGGSAAMQALVGGAVDYSATSFNVALMAYSRGAPIRRVASTGRLPLFALASGPRAAGDIEGLQHIAGRTVGVSALGNADHALLLYVLKRAGVDTDRVAFATLGTNLYEALRAGHVDAGMVQEPALSLLIDAGGKELINFMDLEDAETYLGGAYEFMGVAVRSEEEESRRAEIRQLSRALGRALQLIHEADADAIIDALPSELIAGGDQAQLERVLDQYRRSLYPTTLQIDPASCRRVVESQIAAGLLPEGFEFEGLLNLEVLQS